MDTTEQTPAAQEQTQEVTQGQTLCVSMTVTSPTAPPAGGVWCGIYFYDANMGYKSMIGQYWPNAINANTPTRVHAHVKVPAGATTAMPRYWFKMNTGTYTVDTPATLRSHRHILDRRRLHPCQPHSGWADRYRPARGQRGKHRKAGR
ncbi:hypothetical protein QVA66_09170 [Staphylococcus chromogenes]|nr:hypothetical protein [Staphylococcus chromogenes]